MIDDALRRGEVSYSKVRALMRVATPANEVLLLDHARLMTASQLETIACGWDGTPVDYGAIVGHLVAADGLR